jgi:hypothetical protein
VHRVMIECSGVGFTAAVSTQVIIRAAVLFNTLVLIGEIGELR